MYIRLVRERLPAFFALSLLLIPLVRSSGTTNNIRQIFIGRCYEYQHVINPEPFKDSPKDCDDLWTKFSGAFAYKEPCNVTREDYRTFAEAAVHDTTRDQTIFWENVYPFIYQYSYFGTRLTNIGDTLSGYLANGLTWCGQTASPGINYTGCPADEYCRDGHFWPAVSIKFARKAKGKAYVMLNGTTNVAYDPQSVFAVYELSNLRPPNATSLHVLMANRPGQTIVERCGAGSLLKLEETTKGQGLSYYCDDNPESVRHLLCVDYPNSPVCKFLGSSSAANKTRCLNILLLLISLIKLSFIND